MSNLSKKTLKHFDFSKCRNVYHSCNYLDYLKNKHGKLFYWSDRCDKLEQLIKESK